MTVDVFGSGPRLDAPQGDAARQAVAALRGMAISYTRPGSLGWAWPTVRLSISKLRKIMQLSAATR
jgi:hypothetical protein